MPTSLAQILERKRREGTVSTLESLKGVGKGAMEAKKTAGKIAERERVESQQRFNPLAMALAGGAGFVTGGHVGAGLAALSAPRGKLKPVEAVLGGGLTGISARQLEGAPAPAPAPEVGAAAVKPPAPDLFGRAGRMLEQAAKPENIPRLLPLLKQIGAPKKAIDALEAFPRLRRSIKQKRS
jgi:hypothetical protein